LFLFRFLLLLLLLFSFLSLRHERVHSRSQELLDNEFKNTYVVESWLIVYFKKEKHGELGASWHKLYSMHLPVKRTWFFCLVSYYYYYYYSPFFLCDMNVSTADLRNYWTEFHETWWSYRYIYFSLLRQTSSYF
jgi:hypothetical protein